MLSFSYSSDLTKSTAVDESLSSMNQQFCSTENQLLQTLQQNEKSTQKRKFLIMQERHTNAELELPNIKLFFNNYTIDIFLFVTAIISLLVTTIVLYILCKHMKLKTLVISLALQQIIEVGVETKQEGITLALNIECTCKIL